MGGLSHGKGRQEEGPLSNLLIYTLLSLPHTRQSSTDVAIKSALFTDYNQRPQAGTPDLFGCGSIS